MSNASAGQTISLAKREIVGEKECVAQLLAMAARYQSHSMGEMENSGEVQLGTAGTAVQPSRNDSSFSLSDFFTGVPT